MKYLLVIAGALGVCSSNAGTFYFIAGKSVSAGAATRAAFKSSKTRILKVQASFVKLNEETVRLNKSADATIKDICK